MHRKTAQKILEDDESLDINLLAQAHAEEQSHKKKRPPSIERSLAAWSKLKTNEQNAEGWRRKVKKVWEKKKPS
jgi:hypothetical protein